MSWLGCTAEGEWVHVQGKELCHFCFCIPPSWWSTLWERNLLQGISSFRSKFIPLTVVHFRSMSSSIKAYRNLKNYLLLKDCRTTCHYNYTPSYLNQWRKKPSPTLTSASGMHRLIRVFPIRISSNHEIDFNLLYTPNKVRYNYNEPYSAYWSRCESDITPLHQEMKCKHKWTRFSCNLWWSFLEVIGVVE